MLKLTNLAFSGSRVFLSSTRSVGSVSPFLKNQTRLLSTNTNINKLRHTGPFIRDRFQTPITSNFKFNYKNSQHNFHQSTFESSPNSNEALRSLLTLLGMATATAALYAYGNTYAGPMYRDNHEDNDDESGEPLPGVFRGMWETTKGHVAEIWTNGVWLFNLLRGYRDYGDPNKILPDALPEPYGRAYTMLVDLHLLVHIEYKGYGWAVTKRPGADYFIQYMSRLYELCVLQTTSFSLGTTILDKLDPTRAIIVYRVYAHLLGKSKHGTMKSLEKMNRPLEKLVLLDSSVKQADSPDNVLVVPEWDGASLDTSLLDLIPFLQELVVQNVKDVRPILRAYDGKDIIESYRKQREAAAQQPATQKSKKGTIWEKLK